MFWLQHQGYNDIANSCRSEEAEAIKYNGKEYEDSFGLNSYEMDLRQYDPAIGRWVVQDPVIHHEFSPYSAFDNNPVYWSDPSGADATKIVDKDGNLVGGSFTGQDAIDVFNLLAGISAQDMIEVEMQNVMEIDTLPGHENNGGSSGDGNGNGGGDPKTKAPSKEFWEKIDRLRAGFDFMEEFGGYVEIGCLVLAPFTEGASLGAAPVGVTFTAVGTTGNTILDLIEYKYTNNPAKLISARNRIIKYGLTLGTGKALDKLTFNYTDKLITKFIDIVIDKGIYTPILPTTTKSK